MSDTTPDSNSGSKPNPKASAEKDSSQYSLNELNLETTLGGEGVEDSGRSIPIISLADFASRKAEIADQLWQAATEVGFFQLADHGIAQDQIDNIFSTAESFFALDESIKSKYPLKGGGLNAGWETKAQVRPSTGTADQKESFQVTRPHMEGLWPEGDELPGFVSAQEEARTSRSPSKSWGCVPEAA